MANVVRLSEFRRRKSQTPRAAAAPEPAAQYFCLRCEAEGFRLYASGRVNCARCGALIRNLRVSPSPSTRATDE